MSNQPPADLWPLSVTGELGSVPLHECVLSFFLPIGLSLKMFLEAIVRVRGAQSRHSALRIPRPTDASLLGFEGHVVRLSRLFDGGMGVNTDLVQRISIFYNPPLTHSFTQYFPYLYPS